MLLHSTFPSPCLRPAHSELFARIREECEACPTQQFLVEASYYEVRNKNNPPSPFTACNVPMLSADLGCGGRGVGLRSRSPPHLSVQCGDLVLQIYNEVIYDLLDPGKKKTGRQSLDIKVCSAHGSELSAVVCVPLL